MAIDTTWRFWKIVPIYIAAHRLKDSYATNFSKLAIFPSAAFPELSI